MNNRTNLTALLGHLNKYPHLDNTFSHVSQSRDHLELAVYPFHERGSDEHLVPFAAWARTLTKCRPIETRISQTGQRHFYLRGRIFDGAWIKIVCLPSPEEVDLLEANFPVVHGGEFDVATLLHLVDKVPA